MAATVTIRRTTGTTGAPVRTDLTASGTTRASTSDAPVPGTADPIPIPAGGPNLSYWVVTRLSVDSGTFATVNNVKWYVDAANGFGTGVTVTAQDATTYVQATGTQGTTGLSFVVGNYATITTTPADPWTAPWVVATPKSITGTTSTADGTGAGFGNYMVYQISVASTASPGTVTAETFTWKYDEI